MKKLADNLESQLVILVPLWMRNWVVEEAKRQDRSIAAQVRIILNEHINDQRERGLSS